MRDIRELVIPLPSARLKIPDDDPWRALFDSVLAEEGLSLATMKVPKLRDLFFSRGERAAWLLPDELRWRQIKDDFHHGALALSMSFALPRGSYATMLVKRLQAAVGSPETLSDDDEWDNGQLPVES